MTGAVGIERLSAYLPLYSLALDDLAEARGVEPQKYRIGLGLESMAITPACEDTVTLAANAAAPLFASGEVDPHEIGLLLVATESAVDHAKPVSIFVHELLRAQPACRTYELKHACYSGTAALMTAVQWVASGAARGRKALVIAADIARYDVGSAGEPTQGAGAVAMLVSDRPRLLSVDFRGSGAFAEGVFDFWRPLDRSAALVDGKYSVDCYLRALDGAYRDFEAHRRSAHEASPLPLVDRFGAFLYHVPFPKMASKAHRRLLEADFALRGEDEAPSDDFVEGSLASAVSPYLQACRAVGNSYTASLYFCLAHLLDRDGGRLSHEPISLFSYGSGCCAEFFSGVVGPDAARDDSGLSALLAARRQISVAEYEALRSGQAAPPDAPPDGFRGHFFFAGTERDRRRYLPTS